MQRRGAGGELLPAAAGEAVASRNSGIMPAKALATFSWSSGQHIGCQTRRLRHHRFEGTVVAMDAGDDHGGSIDREHRVETVRPARPAAPSALSGWRRRKRCAHRRWKRSAIALHHALPPVTRSERSAARFTKSSGPEKSKEL